ncbi:MAG: glycosyltransferase family 9 protein [Vicinamibacterales bacterium]
MTILVHHTGSLGDTIVTIPSLRALRAEWPDARIVLLHTAGSAARPEAVPSDAVLRGSGLVDEFLPYARHVGGLALGREVVRVWRAIRRLAPSAAVFVGPSERAPSALRRDAALYRAAGVRRLYGFRPGAASWRGAADAPAPHEAVRKLDRLAADGLTSAADPRWLAAPLIDVDAGNRRAVDAWLDVVAGPHARPVAVGPETLMPSKLWPKDRFVELGRRLLAGGWCPVIVGSGRDDGSAADWVQRWGGGLDAGGRWSVRESAALLSRCEAYVGVDSGLAHLTAAVARPAVVLTSGRAGIGQWDPLGTGHVVLRHRTPCEGCRLRDCPIEDHPCMTSLSIDTVWTTLTAVLRPSIP